MTLGAMFVLVQATEYVTSLDSPLERAVAMGAELVLGVLLLLGTAWLATHRAVRIFTPRKSPSERGPVVLAQAQFHSRIRAWLLQRCPTPHFRGSLSPRRPRTPQPLS